MSDTDEKKTAVLSADPTWKDGYGDVTFESLRETADEIVSFREEVPDDVKGRLEVVRDLIAHSYFEYDFIDVATDQALLTFEMALKERLRSIGLEFDDKVPLAQLIEWGDEKHLFEKEKSSIHALREIRNNTAAHPDGDYRIGPLGMRLVSDIVFTINQLHADCQLRQEREMRRKDLQDVLSSVVEGGAVVEGIPIDEGDTVKLLIHDAEVLFIDNWESPPEYVVGMSRIFDPTPNEEGEVQVPQPIHVCATGWSQHDEAVHFLTGDTEVVVRPIGKEENRRRYQEKWKKPLQEANRSVLDTARRRLGWARRALRRGNPIPAGPIVLGEPVKGTIEPGDSITIEFGPDGAKQVE